MLFGPDMKERVYLDYAATTPVRPEVLDVMLPYLARPGLNASATYASAREARRALEEARTAIAKVLGAQPCEIYFTSGGTESDNWALRGVLTEKRNHLVTTQAEHHAVLDTCRDLAAEGRAQVTFLPVDAAGRPSEADLQAALTDRTAAVSVMFANNEIGTITGTAGLAAAAHAHGALFHTDAVSACGHVPVNAHDCGADLLSLSAHKFYGPPGIGALYIREGVFLSRLLTGGRQERSRRAGTENVAAAVGMAKALQLAADEMETESIRLTTLAQLIQDRLKCLIPGIFFNGDLCRRIPGNVHFVLPGVRSEAALIFLDRAGFSCAAGSACQTGARGPSHVLGAIGLSAEDAVCALRVTLGRESTAEHVEAFTAAIGALHARMHTAAR